MKKSSKRVYSGSTLLFFVLLIIVSLSQLVAAADQANKNPDPIAKVNGEPISNDAFFDVLEAKYGTSVLNNLIIDQLLGQEMKKNGIIITDEEIMRQINSIRAQFQSEAAFASWIRQRGITYPEFVDQVKYEMIVKRLCLKDVKITDNDIKKFYNDNKAHYKIPESVKARHILVATEAEAKTLLDKLNKGADFASLAASNSLDTGTRSLGGELGYIKRGDTIPDFEKAIFSADANSIIGPIKTSLGYHVIKIDDKIKERIPTLDEIRQRVISDIEKTYIKDTFQYIKDLYAKAKVEVFDKKYKQFSTPAK